MREHLDRIQEGNYKVELILRRALREFPLVPSKCKMLMDGIAELDRQLEEIKELKRGEGRRNDGSIS